ncbi:GTPase activating protein [Schizosaccharomyces cryophilus OY26]|uniref:GTPase activating protein n=1 Tax=Schizosaccharomyces cryophilus (strain OY26 / ATCC MYA-4695 / CBS 11777 / NBRC 106824 / NRRL Y48691) TaxID=653667 RepID=S9VTU2_SCHCR|nr:GTPase activating protein [Schizosaccharomyces cryophilus OY26]EPY51288.1 GTPase activating protein [Schizosaccharomyces cryophilus OY26]
MNDSASESYSSTTIVPLEKQHEFTEEKENLNTLQAMSMESGRSSKSSESSLREISLDYSSPGLQVQASIPEEANPQFTNTSMLRPTSPGVRSETGAHSTQAENPAFGHFRPNPSPASSFLSTGSNKTSSSSRAPQSEFEQLWTLFRSHDDPSKAINDSRIQTLIFDLNQQCESESIPVSQIDWLEWACLPLSANEYSANSETGASIASIRNLVLKNHWSVPSPCRKSVWQSLVTAERNELLTLYATLSTSINSLDPIIKRTIRNHAFRGPLEPFKYASPTRAKVSTTGLLHVIHAFTLFDTTVEYALDALLWPTASLLSYMPQGNAFRSLACLLGKSNLNELYVANLSYSEEQLYALVWGCVSDLSPKIALSLQRIKAQSLRPLYPSLACCFANFLPLQNALRIFDLVFCYGLEMFVRLIVVIFLKDESKLLNLMNLDQWNRYLNSDFVGSYRLPTTQKYTFYTRTPVDVDSWIQDAFNLQLCIDRFPSYLSYHETVMSRQMYRSNMLNELKIQNKDLAEHITELESRMVLLNRENTKLSAELSSHRVLRSESEERTEYLRNSIATLEEQLKHLPEQLQESLQQEIIVLKNRNRKFEESNASSIQQITYLNEELEKTLRQLHDLEDKHSQLQARWDSVSNMFKK